MDLRSAMPRDTPSTVAPAAATSSSTGGTPDDTPLATAIEGKN